MSFHGEIPFSITDDRHIDVDFGSGFQPVKMVQMEKISSGFFSRISHMPPCQQKAVSVKISAECEDIRSVKREAGSEIEMEQVQ